MKALILAAGAGTRLRPLTDDAPKCLVNVSGKPIMRYQLEALDYAGVRDCVIVVGYLGDRVRKYFGHRFGNVRITYVANSDYDRTNNLYSLWMARHELDQDMFLLEGDLLFDEGLLTDLDRSVHPDAAVVDRFRPPMNGTVILADGDLSASMVLGLQQSEDFDYTHALKTVNIYKLCQATLRHRLVPALNHYIEQRRTDLFYEAVIAELVAQGDLRLGVHHVGHRQWVEIDDESDLRMAERMLLETRAAAKSPARDAGLIYGYQQGAQYS